MLFFSFQILLKFTSTVKWYKRFSNTEEEGPETYKVNKSNGRHYLDANGEVTTGGIIDSPRCRTPE